MNASWPLGSTKTQPQDEHRIFVKDPTGVFNDDRVTDLYEKDASLPDQASDPMDRGLSMSGDEAGMYRESDLELAE